ncbi:Fic family protein [Arthrobacter sp. zg-Y1110]|uniref:Fic family protein n=1 Tax=Arthrobacter sp. zg-Y1110 TaxID=2886932 RepID=UPI001D1553F3|nr:Fic family protein [Arthrobacter sp. zg-Y1110]MCC3292605.1 Fic family protein [Arthrobacter sp. zg-Y1110]UWX86964.1 Fic family protein [Arthrobacter sp. zg-Y1110]
MTALLRDRTEIRSRQVDEIDDGQDPPDPGIPDLSDLAPVLDPALLSAAEMAVIEMVRFDAANPALKPLLILAEAACSSALDGIHATADQIITGTLAPSAAGPDTGRILATALAVTRTDRGHPLLGAPGIAELHRTITGERAALAGPGLKDLTEFMGRADMPVLAHAGLAHAHFTAAAPYATANGRTGRALVLAMLRAAGVTGSSLIPLSAGLAGNTRGYAWALENYRDGNPCSIVEFFTEAAFITLDNCLMLLADVNKAAEEHRVLLGRTRSPAALHIAADLVRAPALTAATAMAVSGCSESAAYRALDQLTAAGILAPAPKARGTLAWTAPRVVNALESFLSRALR